MTSVTLSDAPSRFALENRSFAASNRAASNATGVGGGGGAAAGGGAAGAAVCAWAVPPKNPLHINNNNAGKIRTVFIDVLSRQKRITIPHGRRMKVIHFTDCS